MKKIVLCFIIATFTFKSYSSDFSVNGIYYTITSLEDLEVGVSGCDNCDTLTIPSSVTFESRTFKVKKVLIRAFMNQRFSVVNLPNTLVEIEQYAFWYCGNLKTIILPNSITRISKGTFASCSNLESIVIPNSVTTIEELAFYRCGIKSVDLPTSIVNIYGEAFLESGLTNITIPPLVTSISGEAFAKTPITKVIIHENVVNIYRQAFDSCTKLDTIIVKSINPPALTENAFSGSTYLTSKLFVPKGTLSAYQAAEGWSKFVNISDNNVTSEEVKCLPPTISYMNGIMQFYSNTDGAKYYYNIYTEDMKGGISEDGMVNLVAAYKITAYAQAKGYTQSNTSEAMLYWVKQSGTLDPIITNINQAEMRGVLASSKDGIITLSGLNDNEQVSFYTIDGKLLGKTNAVNGTASYAMSSGSVVIAKIGDSSIKISVN